MLFGKKKTEIRLSERVLLALRVADQALRKCLEAEEVGWTCMNITQGPIRLDETRYGVTIQGTFYGSRSTRFYKGSVAVQMLLDGDEWKSTAVDILWDEPDILFPEARFHIGFLTDYTAARVESNRPYTGDLFVQSSRRVLSTT